MTAATAAAGQLRRGRGVFALAADYGTFEIGGVPAASLELETCRRELFDVTITVAGWANGEQGVAHFLKMFFLEPAMLTAILINWHENLLETEPISLA
jgi:hypothetical protein